MKLVTFETGQGAAAIGAVNVDAGHVIDLDRASRELSGHSEPAFATMQALIEAGDGGLALARQMVERAPKTSILPLSRTRLLAPLPRPESIRDCLVFERHLKNAMGTWEKMTGKPYPPIAEVWYQRPTWYKGNRFSVVGTETDVQWPSYAELMDYELELACVIGKKGRDLTADNALDHVFGFVIFNDFSARDIQLIERPLGQGPMKGKDFDTGNAIGPWIVTTDEIGDPQNLAMEVRVNGERRGGGNTAEMQHSFARILAFISTEETLYPGEIIASGTVGTGCGLESGTWLQPNDVVELEVEKIGRLRNRIVRQA